MAAIITEIHPREADEARPRLNLYVLPPDGKTAPQQKQGIQPMELDPSEESLSGKQKNFWAFPHEFEIQTPPSKEDHQLKGSESNAQHANSENSIYGED